MIDYEYYAIKFCRRLQEIEKTSDELNLEDIELIRKFKNKLGYSVPVSLEEGTGDRIRDINLSNKYSKFMLNEFEGFRIGSNVKVIDTGEQYTRYITMAETLVDNFNLSKEILYSYIEDKECDAYNEEGVILALGKHIDDDDDVLALVSLDYKVILISTKGLDLLK